MAAKKLNKLLTLNRGDYNKYFYAVRALKGIADISDEMIKVCQEFHRFFENLFKHASH